MNYKLIIAAIVVVLGIGIGLLLWNTFPNQPSQSQLIIGDVEWMLDGDYLAVYIPIENVGTVPVTIESISVRRDTAGSTEYIYNDPEDVSSASDVIAGGGRATFKWNAVRGSAPFDFLQWDNTYVIKVKFHGGSLEKTVTASQ